MRRVILEKPDKQGGQGQRSVSTVISHVDCIHPLYDVMKMSLYLCGLPSKNL